MDLVISVDTSVAHLSAALGRPTWILLPFVPDWRWLLDREDSPWYASVRLFRQPRIDDWEGVLARLRDALAHWLAVNPRRESEPRTGRQRARSSGIGNLRHLEGGNRTEATTETAVGMLHGTSDDFDALHARAVTAAQHGDTTAALRDFDRALRLQPGNAEAWSNRGHALRTAGRLEEACGSYDRAIALRREVPGAWLGKALCLADLGGPEDSLACFDEAVRQAPDDPQAHFLRANVLRRLDRLEAALAAHDRALALRPGHAEGWDRRGLVLEALGRIDAAVESHDRALLIKPGDARAARNKGMALLVSGALAEGFRLYERRWDVEPMASAMPDFPWPRWRGEVPLAGRTLLLHSEQGLGDTLQFCRYAPLAAAAGATVLLEVPEPLTELMGTLEGVDRLVRRGDPLPACDLHSPLMSLPYAFRTTLGTIPARVPYLFADEARTEAWRARLGEARSLGRPGAPDRHALLPRPPEAGRKPAEPRTPLMVGLAWSGNPQHAKDAQRSLAIEALLPYLPVGARYAVLQRDLRETDRVTLESSGRLLHFGGLLGNFADTAALCCAVDLVVSVDTSIAHLAGALGRPTWILLPFAPDWRWMLDREDSPWYPTAKLYRQTTRGDWTPVLERLGQDLAALVAARQAGTALP